MSIHGGKDQEERNEAIRLYKIGAKDVLVATDIAAKGLDFPDIQHVINFDMPAEIENYVHRIGRTGEFIVCFLSVCLFNMYICLIQDVVVRPVLQQHSSIKMSRRVCCWI